MRNNRRKIRRAKWREILRRRDRKWARRERRWNYYLRAIPRRLRCAVRCASASCDRKAEYEEWRVANGINDKGQCQRYIKHGPSIELDPDLSDALLALSRHLGGWTGAERKA